MLHRECEPSAKPTDLRLAARVRAEVPDDTQCVMEDRRARVAEHFDSRRLEGPYHTQAVLEQSRRDEGLEIWARPCGGKCSLQKAHPAETRVCPSRLAAGETLRATQYPGERAASAGHVLDATTRARGYSVLLSYQPLRRSAELVQLRRRQLSKTQLQRCRPGQSR
jgi:hypothetical protein